MTALADDARTPLISVRDLRIDLQHDRRSRSLVRGVGLEIGAGEMVGIVGESGSGKSLTARSLIGLLPENVVARGEVRYGGRNLLDLPERALAGLRGGEIGLVLQDPFTMLNPLHKCGRHLSESLQGMSKAERRADVERRLREVGISNPAVADQYPFQLSGGMRQRVAIAAALARDPRLLIADEPSTALDVTTQMEILELLGRLQQRRQMGILLITHDLRLAFSVCDRVYVFYAGGVLETAHARELEREPLHPYTLALLMSEPSLSRRAAVLPESTGAVPPPDAVRDRCAFSARCAWAADVCLQGEPPLAAVDGPGRASACVRIAEIRSQLSAARNRVDDVLAAPRDEREGEALLTVEGVSKTFKTGSRSVVSLDDVTLDVREGEAVGLVGESGSGKTTLGRCIVGLESSDAGRIVVGGVDVTSYRRLRGSELRRARQTVQMIFQDPYSSLNPARSIGATLMEAIAVCDPSARRARARAGVLLEQVGLPRAYAERRPDALSGGERQRVAIARALALKPRLIVCDEPVSALDVSVQAQILNLLGELQQELGVAYLFISHDLAVVRQIADRIYVLLHGKLVESGSADEVLDAPSHPYTRRLIASVPDAAAAASEALRAVRGS
jgi:peptide/nickel transport system ATP-binding protein